ncbi:MAG: type II secretion system F family protein, partial [Candidatus Hydrogenedentes bacterium]|nr:type II secretion system F family protein [Candidatus Hydrogenedentota bacterium]
MTWHSNSDGGGILGRNERPLRTEDLNLFTEQLASLTASGVPLAPALAELSHELRGGRLGALLERVWSDVEGGTSLEEALGRQGDAIPPLYSSLVRVGERTGNLPAVLQQLSQFGQRYLWLRYRLQVAMAYPVVLLAALLLFLGGFVPHVMGQFEELYASFGRDLPLLSAGVLGFGRGLWRWGLPAGGCLAALSVIQFLLLRSSIWSSRLLLPWERLKLAAPLFGPVYQTVLSARFFRALSLMLAHGAPIAESLHLAGLATGSAYFSQAARQAAAAVMQGEGVSDALRATGVLRRTHCWILQQGERNGKFPIM